MAQQRETATNNLSDIIELIKMGHRSGVLSVERGEGRAFEEGLIVFVNGQVTEAQASAQTGSNALRWLSSWTTCRFSFIVGDNPQTQGTGPQLPTPRTSRPSSPSYPTYPADTGNFPPPGNTPIPRGNTPIPRANMLSPNASSPSILQIPYRTQTNGNVLAYMEQVGLTREHRRLYMLVDGQRSTHELINLMGKGPDKILELLSNLERTRLIDYR
ncbi:hypothetical protein KDW_42870 [Dictyobacter vulcani]|uniref:PatA-like N-terminal domain-containing protein n=1 Tax=Dictyobacter vulcani TaxID=2607529 RepID=A0A5J4KQH9_9CHLR|nr:DUF4388 domain-containing protein [Dictyobacter vulcani]GER90125.1 hypothetical protein KDW_42870 [Dictyobacter vulcani]